MPEHEPESVPDPTSTPTPRPPRRRAAIIATALTIPVVVLLAFAFTAGRSEDKTTTSSSTGVLSPIAVPAPIQLPDASSTLCTAMVAGLPVSLGPLAPRTVKPPVGPFVAAWGDPSVVMRCGVARPKDLYAGSSAQVYVVNAVGWLQTKTATNDVFVAIDRAVYIEVTIPIKLSFQPLPIFATAISKAMPAVCQIPDSVTTIPDDQLCTHRP
ncbi:MAG: hypothetical protein JWM76_4849 [Pseudonocardiales bacterium]|nr:hypothetical protein [Pseudonocardiales bacterium]